MAAFDELRKMARDLYARARASRNPFKKRKLIKLADDYLQQAEEMRRNQVGGAN
jgi:Holliday junction resolvase-like predicted endonuclease